MDKIAKKISGGIGVLRRVRHLLPNHTLITMYNSLVLPYFDYCSIVWGSCREGMCNRLQALQNRATRVVTSSSYDRRSVEILDELGWDNLETRRKRQLATIMFKLKNQIIAPDHLAQIFNSASSMYSYNPRKSTHNLFNLHHILFFFLVVSVKCSFHFLFTLIRTQTTKTELRKHLKVRMLLTFSCFFFFFFFFFLLPVLRLMRRVLKMGNITFQSDFDVKATLDLLQASCSNSRWKK